MTLIFKSYIYLTLLIHNEQQYIWSFYWFIPLLALDSSVIIITQYRVDSQRSIMWLCQGVFSLVLVLSIHDKQQGEPVKPGARWPGWEQHWPEVENRGEGTREGTRGGGVETRMKEERKWDQGPSGCHRLHQNIRTLQTITHSFPSRVGKCGDTRSQTERNKIKYDLWKSLWKSQGRYLILVVTHLTTPQCRNKT